MGGERQGLKGGRYVGGFLQLFDWNAKSRKKLFPSKSDLPEHPKQGKQSDMNFPRIRMVYEDEIGVVVSIKAEESSSTARQNAPLAENPENVVKRSTARERWMFQEIFC